MGKRVAIMQPYFFPYAGYFRLFTQADEFIIYDCVQFPREGRVHRAQVPGPHGAVEWLTLPLEQRTLQTPIEDMVFRPDASAIFARRLARFPWFDAAAGPDAGRVRSHLARLEGGLVDHLATGLALVNDMLGVTTPLRRSSSLNIDPGLHGQARVIATVQSVGGTHYINAPGGRGLYDAAAFAAAGLTLEFLPPYTGNFAFMLPALMNGERAAIRSDIFDSPRVRGE